MDFRLITQKLSASATHAIGVRWGEAFPFYYVSEFPKSGGTWLARMVADYLQIPHPQNSLLPLTFSCVVQNHWRYHPRLRRVFYIYRDGRDVMVSLYFHAIRLARYQDGPGREHMARTYEGLLGRNYDPDEIALHLPRFIEFEFRKPGRGTRVNWRNHIEEWLGARDKSGNAVVYLSYEELRRDTVASLGRTIETVTEEPADPWRLETTVEKMSMKRQTGRDPGRADITQHIRKGIVGDWQNYFTRETAELFDELAGGTLVELGYERDRGWVDRYDYQAS